MVKNQWIKSWIKKNNTKLLTKQYLSTKITVFKRKTDYY